MTKLLPWLKRFQWPRGLRAGLAVGTVLLAAHQLGLPPAAAALGAFNPLLVDNGGPYRTRMRTMLTTILGGALAYVAGSLVPLHIAVIVPLTLVVAFAITFARVVSQPIASSSVLILILYFAGLGGTQHTLRGAALAAGLVILGGIWAVVLSLFFWPLDPFRPARLSVGSCYTWLSQFTDALSARNVKETEDADPGFEWRRQQRARIEAARVALADTAARVPSKTIRAHNLTVLLETADMLLARTMRLSELKATAARLNLPGSSALADDMARWLAAGEHAVAIALDEKPADNAESFGRDGSLRLQFITRRQQQLYKREEVTGDELFSHLLHEERDALLELEIIFDAVRSLWTGTDTAPSNFVSTLNPQQDQGWRDAAQANWTFESAAFRHALRMSIVSAVDVVVMNLIHINHGFWLPMTSIILLQPFSAGTVRKSVQRISGTVAGGILAAILAAALSAPPVMYVVVTGLSMLTVATFAVDYAIYCFFLTPTFVLLSLPHAHDWPYAFIRVGTTLAGATIAVLAMRLLWPERAEVELGHLMQRGAGAAAHYLQSMISFWQFDPSARPIAERQLLAPARRACGLASNDAEEAVDRVMQEPSFGRRLDAETILRTESLTYVTYMRRLTQSITTLALVGTDSPEVRARLRPIAARLEKMASGQPFVPAGLAERNSGAAYVDLAEEQMQRIERQTAVLERAAARIWQVAPELEPLASPEQEQREAGDRERSRQSQP
jgi:uncharacterized membrane protein YccC